MALFAAPVVCCAADETWEFPEIARYVRHFDVRIRSPKARLGVLTELTYFHPRNSRLYPPFFRRLLKDPSPRLRWEALSRLDDHGIRIPPENVPDVLLVPLAGLLDRTEPDSVARFRRLAAGNRDAAFAGWAIKALGLIGDADSVALAERLISSKNVFVRYSAAVALVHLGKAKKGRAELAKIVDARAPDDMTGYYRWSAAERLCRLGDWGYFPVLLGLFNARKGYADGPLGTLEDLTGQYFLTLPEWRRWWERKGKAKLLPKDPAKGAPRPAARES
jgi:hypothetical protein